MINSEPKLRDEGLSSTINAITRGGIVTGVDVDGLELLNVWKVVYGAHKFDLP